MRAWRVCMSTKEEGEALQHIGAVVREPLRHEGVLRHARQASAPPNHTHPTCSHSP